MAFGDSHKFLFCLPVRLGVLVLSLLETLAAGVVSVALWFVAGVMPDQKHHLSASLNKVQRIAAVLLALLSTILVVVSLLGFAGSFLKRRIIVSTYSYTLNWLVGLYFAAGIFWAVTIFTESPDKFTNRCIDGSTDQNVINLCHNSTKYKFIVLVVFILGWLAQLYSCVIVARYAIQLLDDEEELYRLSKARPYHYERARSEELLTQPRTVYPYSDGHISLGNTSSV